MNKRCMGCMNEYSEEFEICPYCGFIENTEPDSPLHMEPGTYLADRYIVGRVVGYGGFGVTYIGWDAKLEQKVAIKEYLPSEFSTRAPGHSQLTIYSGDKAEQFSKGLNQFVDEAKRLAKFQNTTGIVKVFDSFEENQTAYIIMEYLEGETLAAKLKRDGVMAADDAIALLMPIIESLETVHKAGILHRDIAPDNIFITKDGDAKLIDFGAARYATTGYSMSLTVLIKPGFSPEEQYRTKGDQGPHTDVYSMAATLYKTITGKTPPDSLKRRVEFEKSNKDILFPLHKFVKEISESTENAIMNALNVRIEDRTPTMEAFIGELKSDNVKRVGNKIRRIDILRWPLWAKISVSLMSVALVVIGILFGFGVIGFDSFLNFVTNIPDGMTRIPNVINTELSSAEKKLGKNDLNIYVEGQEYSNDIPMNFIKSQNPGGGAIVDKMTSIKVQISAGIDGAIVPDLYALSVSDAKSQLKKLSFKYEIVKEYDDTIAEDCVVKQSVEAGKEVAKGTVIALTVSKGRDPSKDYSVEEVEVLNLVGLKYDQAMKKAAKAKLIVKIAEKKYSDSVDEDIVMAQSISAGKIITNDKVIELTVSLGKKTIVVPYVIGATESAAKTMLDEKELKYSVEYENSDSFAAGLVMSQSVAAKKEVSPGTVVKITVSKGAASFAVPNVVGKSEASAKSTLNSKGLKVSVTYAKNSSVAEGTVISQTPASGNVKSGDTVTITVSNGKPSYAVANVVGKSQSDAEKALKNQGFKVSVSEEYSSSVENGKVIRQNPIAGSSQIEGSTISIVVSKGKQPVTVTFNANGGSVSTSSSTVYLSATYGSLPAPSRTGYSFNGWYTSANGGTKITSSSSVSNSSSHTLYAQWSVNSYTYNIVYKSSNGTQLGTSTAKYNYGTTNTISPKSYSGYNTPSAQSIKWDSTSAKTITFTYSPSAVSTSQRLVNGAVWGSSNGVDFFWFDIDVKYRNRTANSVEVQLVWSLRKTASSNYNYTLYSKLSINGSQKQDLVLQRSGTWPWNGGQTTGSYTSSWYKVDVGSSTQSINIVVDPYRYNGSAVVDVDAMQNMTLKIPTY